MMLIILIYFFNKISLFLKLFITHLLLQCQGTSLCHISLHVNSNFSTAFVRLTKVVTGTTYSSHKFRSYQTHAHFYIKCYFAAIDSMNASKVMGRIRSSGCIIFACSTTLFLFCPKYLQYVTSFILPFHSFSQTIVFISKTKLRKGSPAPCKIHFL